MVSALNKRAKVPSRRELLSRMRAVKTALMLDAEFVAITTDGWTSRNNESYMSLTVAYIDYEWKLHHLSLDCAKHTGTTTGEDLAALVAGMIERHDLTGRVIACVTDCEPSMIKAGRLLEVDGGTISHIGCSNHRMESTTSSVFNGRSLGALGLARTLVGRYKKSSQMAARLVQLCGILQMEPLSVMQDVETRWWSTWAMVVRLLYLMKAIKLHESMDEVHPLLSDTDWEVLRLIEPILRPFMKAQKDLEGAQYVTGSMTIGKMAELREGLEAAITDLKAVAQQGLKETTQKAMEAVRPDAEALMADFTNRWGDGSNILEYREGKRRQPQGFKRKQVYATALDPRAKHLYGIQQREHAGVWRAVASAAVDIALGKHAGDKAPASAEKPASDPVQTQPAPLGGGQGASKRPRMSAFEAAAAAHAADAGDSNAGDSADGKREQLVAIVEMEVSAFKAAPGIRVRDMQKTNTGDKKVFNNPLDWWRKKQLEYPLLAALARRVLAIPSSQAQSERMFSTAGLTVTPTRSRLLDENVELLVYLRNVWGVVDEWKKSATRKKKMSSVSML
ncbi:conserved unknown protein [Ectocarpus siliculosus]|uniref:HAT C-terminal dimerisation domain-containing protein n=1 Tax=Ectocarpus siliculosus TaxID=2880 RepID=D7G5Z0_ECTSI|nr:conserved unknown protein [Ectocarpus siliculosus]|eukprot:CBJ33910.1 conserved unknown protein [Ectocarpus siliculosus]